MSIKLVVCDLDGTLLHDDKSMDRSIKLILESKPGFQFTIASGRNFHIVQDIVSNLRVDIPYILNNGANMWLGNTCLFNANMDAKQLRYACNVLHENNVSYLAYTNDTIYSVGNPNKLGKFMDRLKGKCHLSYDASIGDFVDQDIFKVIMIDPKMDTIKDKINATCDKLQCIQSEGEVYALTSIAASKGATLSRLMKEMQLSKDEVLVFGDNYNDASMFEVATGIAMGNAQDALKQKAYDVTLSNNHDGVSAYLVQHILKKQA